MGIESNQQGPLDRTFAILDFVASQPRSVAAAEIAQGLGYPLSTVHRLLGNLEARGLLQRALGTKRYAVGSALVELSGRTIGSAFRTARRHVVLQNVATEIGEQCEIGIVRHNV